jgi:hypothetical protein
VPAVYQPRRLNKTAVWRRSPEVCCEVTGYCVGNTDSAAEPDVRCIAHSRLKQHAGAIRGR